MSRSPALPWEVIERVIDHSAKNTGTLYSLTLTCRDLRPRSTILLLDHVQLWTRNQLFDLCALLQTNSHLLPCVRSVSMPAHEFSPHPLLRILPNLSEIEFRDVPYKKNPLTFHASVLTHCRLFGQHIQTLSLQDVHFPSLSAFSDILLSFPRIESLSCESLSVENYHEHAHQELIARRLSERLRLRTLTIDGAVDVNNTPLTLLMDAAKHGLVTLILTTAVHKFGKLLLGSPSDWVQLNSLTWRAPLGSIYESEEGIQHILAALENFRPPNLQEVTVLFHFSLTFRSLLVESLPMISTKLRTILEETLITFPRPTISFACKNILNERRYHSWMPMFRRFFPVLAEHHGLNIDTECSGRAGHDDLIQTPIVVLTDSRWAATGSKDGTIIIWDLQTGCISQEWFADDHGVESLAFSPDSQYIMSVTSSKAAVRGKGPTIWDLQGVRTVNSLTGPGSEESNHQSSRHGRMHCAWSPDGSWIMAGSRRRNGAIHIWETTAFACRSLHFPSTALKGALLAFSADGHRVITTTQDPPYNCWIWDVKLGKLHLHQSLSGHIERVTAAAFNPVENTHVVTGSDDSTIRIWDAKTGEQLLVFGNQEWEQIGAVAFSADGRMVLSHFLVKDEVEIWDASNGALLASLSGTSCFSKSPQAACFSPCGSYIAAASDDGAALLWSTSDWSCVAKVSGGRGRVTHVTISFDGRVLCCGTDKGTVFFRHIQDLVSASQD